MASAALTAIRRTVTVDWPKAANEDAKKFLIETARAGHAKIMADATRGGGAAPEFEAYAATPGRPIESVRVPEEAIIYRYFFNREVARVAVVELVKASPVRSGAYARGHTIYFNGEPVEALPNTVKTSDEIFIANPVPYARRLEVGKTKSGRAFVMQVQPHIYERVAHKLATRYRNIAKVWFGYVNIPDSHVVKGRLNRTTYGVTEKWDSFEGGKWVVRSQVVQRRRYQKAGKRVQSPAIFIKFER